MAIAEPLAPGSRLIELRKRLLNILALVLVVFIVLVFFANDIYQLVSALLMSKMPVGTGMLATNAASLFFTPIKLTLYVAVFISAPFILYQIWAFVAPALYQHERHLVMPLLFSSTALFYFGAAFAYFALLPQVVGSLPQTVSVNVVISDYLGFVMGIFMVFGIVFEIPVAIILACRKILIAPDVLQDAAIAPVVTESIPVARPTEPIAGSEVLPSQPNSDR